ncbi:MAG: hypothetical protein GX591_03710 [Planctomycetes bacterium]|nr:hypothetical protein [Planctomycetota bacterium]
MSKVTALVEFAADVGMAYQKARSTRNHPKVAGADLLMVLAGLMILTAVGFALAGVYRALSVLGVVSACLLMAVISLAVSLLALEVSRRLLQYSNRT